MKTTLFVSLCFIASNFYSQTIVTDGAAASKEDAAAISAQFSANKVTICVGESIQFTDNSTGSPTTWAWQFSGGSPASSGAQNPLIQYNTPGSYNVILTASSGNDQNTLGKLSLIRVEACTGLNDNSNETGLRIFPVPATNVLYLQSYKDAQFAILNLSGQMLQSGTVAANQTLAVNTNTLAPGIYFIRTVENGISSVSKIIIE